MSIPDSASRSRTQPPRQAVQDARHSISRDHRLVRCDVVKQANLSRTASVASQLQDRRIAGNHDDDVKCAVANPACRLVLQRLGAAHFVPAVIRALPKRVLSIGQSVDEGFAFDQRRRVRQMIGADDANRRRMLASELSDLQQQRPDQGIKQDRQDRDRKQRSAITQLIAHLADVDQPDRRQSRSIQPAEQHVASLRRSDSSLASQCSQMEPVTVLVQSRRTQLMTAEQTEKEFLEVMLSCRVRSSSSVPVSRMRPRCMIAIRSHKSFDFAHDVSRKDQALARLSQRANDPKQVSCNQHIQAQRRFVKDQDRWIMHHRSRDRHLLFHAGRHFRAGNVTEFVHSQLFKQRFQPIVAVRCVACRAVDRSTRPFPRRSCGRRSPCCC